MGRMGPDSAGLPPAKPLLCLFRIQWGLSGYADREKHPLKAKMFVHSKMRSDETGRRYPRELVKRRPNREVRAD